MNAATPSTRQAREQLGNLPAELRAIDSLTTGELRTKFAAVFGYGTATRNRTYLRRKIKYRIQELALGGLSDHALARAAELAEAGRLRHGTAGSRARAGATADWTAKLPEDRCLRRVYNGKEYKVEVLLNGAFAYEGRRYTSLSTIAKEITQTVWNGKLFFGLKSRAKGGK